MSKTSRNLTRILSSLLAAIAAFLVIARGELRGQDAQEAPRPSQLKARAALLRSRFHAEREKAVEALGAAGTEAAALLEKAVASDYPQERACALRALCRAAPGQAAKLLVQAVLHESLSVRTAAIGAVKSLSLRIEDARSLLAQAGKLPPDRRPALRAIIAGACRKQVEELLRKIEAGPAGGGQFPGKYRELTSLGHVVEPALSKIASDPSHNLAEAAAAALCELADKESIPALKRAYLAGGGELREWAAAALHILGEDGPYKEIETLYKKACEEGGQHTYSTLALFYDRAREYGKGVAILKKMIVRHGARAIDHINLACMLSVQNKVDEAFAEFVKGVDKGYTNMDWVKIDGELANLRAFKQFKEYVRKKFPEAFKEEEKPQTDGENK